MTQTAATLLAGTPIELYADIYAWTYRRTRELGGLGVTVIPRIKATVRLQDRCRALERWEKYISKPRDNSGRCVIEVIRPRLIKWVERAGGEMSYRATQVFTGHGCFDSYLRRIVKRTMYVAIIATGHGAAHARGLPGVGGGAPCPRPEN
ncbi:hypothetical protein ACFW04_011813 [Cataglyphis niger]